ncbi:MAG: hypothetical protein RBU30_22590 [Polyangia bacterium]|nr:hypothetical protein [Polyangia bacterium]
MPLFLFLRLRYLRALLIGLGVAGLLTLVGATGGKTRTAQGAEPGPPREAQLASLYEEPDQEPTEQWTSAQLKDRAGYWAGTPDSEILGKLRKSSIRKISFNRGGSSLSFKIELSGRMAAAFKPEQIHEQTVPRKEVAAYRINRLLGLSRVPPATCRTLTLRDLYTYMDPEQRHLFFRIQKEARFLQAGNLAGEVSYWIPQIRYMPIDRWSYRENWHQWLKAYKKLPARWVSRTAQLSVMLIFDFLINNPDRFSGHNTMSTMDGKFLYFMDNAYSFHLLPRGGKVARGNLERVQRFSRSFFARLKSLDEKKLRAGLDEEAGCPWPLLTDEEIKAVLDRRRFIIQHVNAVVARYGWERTMVFP